MKYFLIILILATSTALSQLKVASLNPILTDLLQEVGGDRVQVIKIVRPGMDVHRFQPHSKDFKQIGKCRAIYAMGKGLEPYLDAISETLTQGQQIIEVGRDLPSQKVDADPLYTCCPHHDKNTIDPHWWHNVKNIERATRVIYKSLKTLDPANKSYYKQRSNVARQHYRNLHNWVKSEVSQIDSSRRTLVTAHAAFAYFCKAYGFQAAYVQGLSREGKIPAKLLNTTIQMIKNKGIKAVFPEESANPKTLKQIAKEAGIKVAKPIYADNFDFSYTKTIQYNVNTIVSALR